MDVSAAFIADDQPLHLVEPGEGALHNPAVLPEPLAGVDAWSRDSALDPSISQYLLISSGAVALVGVEFSWALARMPHLSSDRWDGVEQGCKKTRLMHVGSRDHLREGNAVGVDHKMALRARFATIRRSRPGFLAPFFAGTVEASTAARLQSSWSASRNRLSSSCWSRSQTPAACQSRKRRQQVMPLPQPSSCGSMGQGIPERSTKMIPARHARSGMRGLPPFGFRLSGGSSGAITVHNSSGTRGVAIRTYPCNFHGFVNNSKRPRSTRQLGPKSRRRYTAIPEEGGRPLVNILVAVDCTILPGRRAA